MQWIHPFLQAQNLSYLILLVEQTDEKPFNRAKLFNIGVIESKVHLVSNRAFIVAKFVFLYPLEMEKWTPPMFHLS